MGTFFVTGYPGIPGVVPGLLPGANIRSLLLLCSGAGTNVTRPAFRFQLVAGSFQK